jgi:hypothetical protein
MLYCWDILYSPGYGEGTEGAIFAAMNGLVHVIMYGTSTGNQRAAIVAGLAGLCRGGRASQAWPFCVTAYYAMRVLGFQPPGDVAITCLQILQMVVGAFIAGYRVANCDLKRPFNAWCGLAMYASYFYLFARFFAKRYILNNVKAHKAA